MFETSVLPGWYTTIYPYYYTAGFFISVFALASFIGILAMVIFKIENRWYQNWSIYDWLFIYVAPIICRSNFLEKKVEDSLEVELVGLILFEYFFCV